MRQWNNRAQTPAQYDINRIRSIGEWGQASRYVGGRWERAGLERLEAGVVDRNPVGLLAICSDQALQETLAATGSKNPDVVLLFESDENIVAQPADLKWSLDVASYRQISAAVLAELLTRALVLEDAIRSAVPPSLRDRPIIPRDGFFFAPRSLANERFLTSPENLGQEYPIEPKEVLLETVDPFWFFGPLPGWNTGQELARIDGANRSLSGLDTADRYYHIGAGVAGAIVLSARSVFDSDEEIDRDGELARLREFAAGVSSQSTGAFVDRLAVVMRQRQALTKQLRDLSRSAFTFRDFVVELVEANLADPADIEPDLRRGWSAVYWPVVEAQDAENRVVGRRLRAKGSTDVEALDRLTHEKGTITKRMRARARAAIQARTASPDG
jgi:hypothetical protein